MISLYIFGSNTELYGSLNSDRVLCHFCFKPKKVTNEALAVDHAKKSQVLVSSVILLKTALDALPLLYKVPQLSVSHTHNHNLEPGIPEVTNFFFFLKKRAYG